MSVNYINNPLSRSYELHYGVPQGSYFYVILHHCIPWLFAINTYIMMIIRYIFCLIRTIKVIEPWLLPAWRVALTLSFLRALFLRKWTKFDTWVLHENFNKKMNKIFLLKLSYKTHVFSRRNGLFFPSKTRCWEVKVFIAFDNECCDIILLLFIARQKFLLKEHPNS